MKAKAPGFFSIFILTVMVTVEALTVLALWYLQLLTPPLLLLLGAVLGLMTAVILRTFFPRKHRFVRIKRFFGSILSMALTSFCLVGCIGSFLVGGTLNNMFGSDALGGDGSISLPQLPVGRQSFAVYLSGSDTRGSTTKSRSDVNIIAAVNPRERQLLLVNTPRDFYVANPAGKGAMDKLAHCGLYGTDNSRKALSKLYDVPIAYAAQINFKGFETLIDALGGVRVVSDVAFTTTDTGYYIKQGENQLNGAQALAFARERSHLPGGDEARGKNQMRLIAALIAQASPSNLMSNYREILSSLEGMFATDMPLSTITKLVTTQLSDLNDWQVFSYSVTGTGGTDYNYSSGTNAYVMYPDQTTVSHASDLLNRVLDEQPLTQSDIG